LLGGDLVYQTCFKTIKESNESRRKRTCIKKQRFAFAAAAAAAVTKQNLEYALKEQSCGDEEFQASPSYSHHYLLPSHEILDNGVLLVFIIQF